MPIIVEVENFGRNEFISDIDRWDQVIRKDISTTGRYYCLFFIRRYTNEYDNSFTVFFAYCGFGNILDFVENPHGIYRKPGKN
jgi:hypothetical protein